MDRTMIALDPELARWRAETPNCESRVHLNNAGAALSPQVVGDAVRAHLDLEERIGAYEAAEARASMVQESYEQLARLVGTRARNIGLVQNSTVAFAQALGAFDFTPDDVVLTTRADYASNQIMYLSLAQRRGVEIVRAPDAPEGGVDVDQLGRLIQRHRPKLVAVTWIPTNSGLVQPVEQIGRLCQEVGVPYLVDACQAIGQTPIDVNRIGCDYLAATARKFLRGPRGLGLLYVSDRMLQAGAHPLLVDMHGATWTEPDAFELAPDAKRFETWEFSYALVLGLGAAAAYANAVGSDQARDRARRLADYARSRLAMLPGVRVLDRGPELCAIVTVAISGRETSDVKLQLRARGINTSSPHREDAVIDMDEKRTIDALRISPHYYNTKEEIDTAVETLQEILSS
jgi:selenocysteine lyase/cysteine desulfurase